jgi:hypothetical protein
LNIGVSRNRFCDFLADPDSRSFSRFGAIIMQFAARLYTNHDHFTETGSGQTYDRENSTRGACFAGRKRTQLEVELQSLPQSRQRADSWAAQDSLIKRAEDDGIGAKNGTFCPLFI